MDKDSFLIFNTPRGVIKTSVWIDLALKYTHFKYFKFIKHII